VGAVRGAGEPDADGWARVELPVESHSAAIGDLLRFGPHVRVLEPPELRAQIAASLLAMSAHYAL
jgi:predicted DNA-binding transcriptional regulator YafY